MPLRAEICGELDALSATESVAVKLAADAGVKVTEMVQFALAASVLPQVVVAASKSLGFVPVILMAMPVSEAVPVLKSVALIAVAVEPTDVLGKARVAGANDAWGAVAVTTAEFVPVAVV